MIENYTNSPCLNHLNDWERRKQPVFETAQQGKAMRTAVVRALPMLWKNKRCHSFEKSKEQKPCLTSKTILFWEKISGLRQPDVTNTSIRRGKCRHDTVKDVCEGLNRMRPCFYTFPTLPHSPDHWKMTAIPQPIAAWLSPPLSRTSLKCWCPNKKM